MAPPVPVSACQDRQPNHSASPVIEAGKPQAPKPFIGPADEAREAKDLKKPLTVFFKPQTCESRDQFIKNVDQVIITMARADIAANSTATSKAEHHASNSQLGQRTGQVDNIAEPAYKPLNGNTSAHYFEERWQGRALVVGGLNQAVVEAIEKLDIVSTVVDDTKARIILYKLLHTSDISASSVTLGIEEESFSTPL